MQIEGFVTAKLQHVSQSRQQHPTILTSILEKEDPTAHIKEAIKGDKFPLAVDIPLPKDIREAIDFITRTPRGEILTFWEKQKLFVESLASKTRCQARQRENLDSFSDFDTELMRLLMEATGMEGSEWIEDLRQGFNLPEKYTRRASTLSKRWRKSSSPGRTSWMQSPSVGRK